VEPKKTYSEALKEPEPYSYTSDPLYVKAVTELNLLDFNPEEEDKKFQPSRKGNPVKDGEKFKYLIPTHLMGIVVGGEYGHVFNSRQERSFMDR
jgi:hypothetical protein